VFYVEISDSRLRQEVWSSDIYEQSLILVWVQKTGHSYESLQKMARSKTRYFAYEWEQRKGHYDVVGSLELTIQRWKWHVSIRTRGNWVLLFPTREDASLLQEAFLNNLTNRLDVSSARSKF
jgi:hypothetical protein